MSENPYSNQVSSTNDPIDSNSHALQHDNTEWKQLLLDVASKQKTLALLTIAFSQFSLLGYLLFGMYSSFLSGSAPSPSSFLFVFAALTLLPTIVAGFLFRTSQLNREWATGKGNAVQALLGSQALYKSATLVLAGYIVLILILAMGLLGIIPLYL